MQELMKILDEYGAFLGVLALIGVEISPIKINPISLIGNAISAWLGIGKLEKKIDNVKNEVDKNELDRIRYEILQFSRSLRNGEIHEENDFIHIEELYEKYTNKGGNSYIHSEMNYIRDCHNKRG